MKGVTAGIISLLNPALNIPTAPTGFLMSAVYKLYRFCSVIANWTWGILRPIVLFLDPIFREDTRKECFTILGLAGSIIPAVYNAGAKRTRGILIADMTKYFFPLYGIVMLQNFVLSITGQFVENLENWKYLLPATLVTTVYSILLLLATGLYERVSRLFISVFIYEQSRILRPKITRRQRITYKNKRAAFLADLSTHIANQTAATNTPHCNTDKCLKREIRQIVNFMLSFSELRALKKKKPSRILDEFDLLFPSSKQTHRNLRDSIYYELPASESIRNFFTLQIELSCEFWKQLLAPLPSLNEKAHTACRIFDSMKGHSKKRYGSLTVMTCGLIVYLYKSNHENATENASCNVDYCANFVQEMWNIFQADLPFINNTASLPNHVVSLYAEMLLILYGISQIEKYLQADRSYEDSVKHLLDTFWKGAHVHIGRELLMDTPFQIYLTLALHILRQLPSPANRPLSPAQKKKIRIYVFSQKTQIGA